MSSGARLVTQEELRLGEVGEALAWGGTERLLGDITHELNNALGVVLNNAMLLAATAEPGTELATDARELLEGARWAVELSRLMSALGHRHSPGLHPVDVAAVVSSLEPVLRRGLGTRAELRLTIDAGLPPVWVDPNVLSRALLAVVLARADEVEGGAELAVHARLDDAHGAVVIDFDAMAVEFDPIRAGGRALVAAAGGSLEAAETVPGHAALTISLPLASR